LNKYSSCES